MMKNHKAKARYFQDRIAFAFALKKAYFA